MKVIFTRASTNKNDQREEPRKISNNIKYELGNDTVETTKKSEYPRIFW